ncbi:MAG: hypothetical protein ACR2IT_12760 [Pirellulales bacterium]
MTVEAPTKDVHLGQHRRFIAVALLELLWLVFLVWLASVAWRG